MAKKNELRGLLKEDTTYRRVIKQLSNADEKVEDWMQEIMNLHSRRAIRALNTRALLQSAQKISIDSNLENQAVRSRVVEIKMRCLQQLIVVEKYTKKLKKYIGAQYSDVLADMYSTMKERQAEIDHQMSRLVSVQDALQGVVKLSDVLIDDLDSAGYTLMRVGNMLEMKSRDR